MIASVITDTSIFFIAKVRPWTMLQTIRHSARLRPASSMGATMRMRSSTSRTFEWR
jgi:hypothetical protein